MHDTDTKSQTTSQATANAPVAGDLDSKNNNRNENNNNNNNISNGVTPMQIGDEDAAAASLVPVSDAVDNQPVKIAELLGEFGLYQLMLTILSFVRYSCTAFMTNTGPLLAPTIPYSCHPPASIVSQIKYPSNYAPNNYSLYLNNKCQLELINNQTFRCTNWSYNQTDFGHTLTDAFDLVCDRDWLRSAFQSCVSVGVVVACVMLGSFSDEFGRRMTLRVCTVVTLCAGLISCWAPSFKIYAISRAISTMSDLGIAGSVYTIIVETFGKHRGTVCLIVFTGWSMGVMVMPWITSYFLDFRKVMIFTITSHIITLPGLLMVGESVRWLLVNGRLAEAQAEVRRVCRWNSVKGAALAKVECAFHESTTKYLKIANKNALANAKELANSESNVGEKGICKGKARDSMRVVARALFGGFYKMKDIFKSSELIMTTVVITWTSFNSELLYMLFVMINSDVGDNVKLNYAVGGLMEVLATLISIVMISKLTRRLSLSSTLFAISVSMFGLAFNHSDARVSVWVLNFTKFAISTLSSLVYVIVTELYPTNMRQTATGLISTIASFGAVIAPFVRTELTELIGMTNVMLILCLMPLSSAIILPLFLRETKGKELADDMDDLT